jgi:MFS family permease
MTLATETDPAVAAQGGEPPVPAIAVASIILSMMLVAIGNGLLFAYIPIRLADEGLPPTWAGAILTGLSAGGMAGCFLTGRLVRRVGHARTFMMLSALIILSNAVIAAGAIPLLWIASRMLYGFAISGLFIVGQSWLNDVVDNSVRGRTMAIFYVAYIIGLGLGSFSLTYIDIAGPAVPVVGIVFGALSIIPVGMTRLRPPPPPESAAIAFRHAWSVSPVGLSAMLAVGGLSMMVAGFAPIHATASGYTKDQVALLLMSMQFGTILMQLPLGWISDRIDRRYVLIAASLLVLSGAIAANRLDGAAFALIIMIYMVWSGATESIYSISSAHANDRAEKGDLVALSSTMLFAWSLSGFLVPGLATGLTAVFGTHAFMYIAAVIASCFAGFVAWRMKQAHRGEPTAKFAPMSAQAPLPADLAFAPDTETQEGLGEPLIGATRKRMS